jgi:hypothetical protein
LDEPKPDVRRHCVRCHGPWDYHSDKKQQDGVANRRDAAKTYVEGLKACRVIVPFPADKIACEKVIMDSRRGIVAAAGAATEDGHDAEALQMHLPPNIVQFCEKCMHQGDLAEIAEI